MCYFLLFLENYNDLYHWSVECYSDFWAKFWKFSGIIFSCMYDEVSRVFAYGLSPCGCDAKRRLCFWEHESCLLSKPHIDGKVLAADPSPLLGT